MQEIKHAFLTCYISISVCFSWQLSKCSK